MTCPHLGHKTPLIQQKVGHEGEKVGHQGEKVGHEGEGGCLGRGLRPLRLRAAGAGEVPPHPQGSGVGDAEDVEEPGELERALAPGVVAA